jgi:hypothetical protein
VIDDTTHFIDIELVAERIVRFAKLVQENVIACDLLRHLPDASLASGKTYAGEGASRPASCGYG